VRTIPLASIPTLSMKESEDMTDRLTEEADAIDEQLVDYKAGKSKHDSEWAGRAVLASKIKRRTVNRLQQHIKMIKRREYEAGKVSGERTFESCFVAAAYRMLAEDTLDMLREMADKMVEA
jgi:hypothetical protein